VGAVLPKDLPPFVFEYFVDDPRGGANRGGDVSRLRFFCWKYRFWLFALFIW